MPVAVVCTKINLGWKGLRARAMVFTGERILSDKAGERQYSPRARQTATDNYVYRLSRALKNRLQRAHQGTDSDAKLRHSPVMPAAEKYICLFMRHQTTSFPMGWNLRCSYQVRSTSVEGLRGKVPVRRLCECLVYLYVLVMESVHDWKMDENIESLIEEVEKRPAIYNKTLREYAYINIKKQLWQEVCAAVVPNWSSLEGENKTRVGKFTQTLL